MSTRGERLQQLAEQQAMQATLASEGHGGQAVGVHADLQGREASLPAPATAPSDMRLAGSSQAPAEAVAAVELSDAEESAALGMHGSAVNPDVGASQLQGDGPNPALSC